MLISFFTFELEFMELLMNRTVITMIIMAAMPTITPILNPGSSFSIVSS